MTMGALGTTIRLVVILFFSYQLRESVPGVISFFMGIVIGNWSREKVEYCMDLCTSLKSFGALIAGRLKHSIPYQSYLDMYYKGIFFS